MPIDNCPYTFAELTTNILPKYMAVIRSSIGNPKPMSDFTVKGDGVATIAEKYNLKSDFSGCYVLIDNDKPIYVGISRFVLKRLRQHVIEISHNSATLAYKIACDWKPHDMTRSEAMEDKEFMETFAEALKYINSLDVAFVVIENPVELYIFEAYCALELDTSKWNTFKTH